MFEIYLGNAVRLGQPRLWYWRYRAKNGRTMADGSEGYATRFTCRRGAKKFCALIGAPAPTIKYLDI